MGSRRDIVALAGGLLLGIAALHAQESSPATGTLAPRELQQQETAPQQTRSGREQQPGTEKRFDKLQPGSQIPSDELGIEFDNQEPIVPPIQREAAIRLLTTPPVDISSTAWLREEVDPILQQRRKLRKMMEQRAQESVIRKPEGTSQSDPNRTAGLWKMTVGNTSAENWSPFEDRALDARTLRFPAPRNMSPDKRTESMKRVDRLNKMRK